MCLPAEGRKLEALVQRSVRRAVGPSDGSGPTRSPPDLYYRLTVVGFRLSRLREQRADILPPARKFLSECPVGRARDVMGISPQAMAAMGDLAWPGNVRELRNVIDATLPPGSRRARASAPNTRPRSVVFCAGPY
ncbi:MAG TPA: hypothetical protein VM597_04580 [Gemmataceae bacterium]|nr:hypothetical protein [Gemmataceae bacterium]